MDRRQGFANNGNYSAHGVGELAQMELAASDLAEVGKGRKLKSMVKGDSRLASTKDSPTKCLFHVPLFPSLLNYMNYVVHT